MKVSEYLGQFGHVESLPVISSEDGKLKLLSVSYIAVKMVQKLETSFHKLLSYFLRSGSVMIAQLAWCLTQLLVTQEPKLQLALQVSMSWVGLCCGLHLDIMLEK